MHEFDEAFTLTKDDLPQAKRMSRGVFMVTKGDIKNAKETYESLTGEKFPEDDFLVEGTRERIKNHLHTKFTEDSDLVDNVKVLVPKQTKPPSLYDSYWKVKKYLYGRTEAEREGKRIKRKELYIFAPCFCLKWGELLDTPGPLSFSSYFFFIYI